MIANKTIALIGGRGFIGTHLSKKLAEAGNDVYVIDPLLINNFFTVLRDDLGPSPGVYARYLAEREDLLLGRVHSFHMDARDYDNLCHVLAALKPDIIIHMAAIAHIDRADRDPKTAGAAQLETLINALDIATDLDVEHFVYFSSSTIYGDFVTDPIKEEDCWLNAHKLSIYGANKLAGEIQVNGHHAAKGLPTTIIRPCAAYGPMCISGRVVQKFVEGAVYDGKFTIFGDGQEKEDFTHVGDICRGVEAVLSNREASSGDTFNIAAGSSRSLADLADVVRSCFEEPIEVATAPKDNLKPSRGTMCVDKARNLLDWEPKVTLETGIPEYVEWVKTMKMRMGNANPERGS